MEDAKTANVCEDRKQQFAEKMMGHLNSAGLSLMVSIGHRTGLWDAMGGLPPSRVGDIAAAAGLNERYVREALAAYVTGGIVEYETEGETYFLPPEHAAFLTRDAAPNNMAATTQFVAVLGAVEDRIVECFQKGGGVKYEEYARFHEVMAEESRQTVVLPLIDQLLPLVPGLKEKLEKGISVLDAGCGSGQALVRLARHFSNSRFTGYDLCVEAVERAQREVLKYGLRNLTFEVKDVAQLGSGQQFDLITTFDAVHDQAEPAAVLRNIFLALKDNGVYFMQEIAGSGHLHQDREHALAPFLYTISCLHCMTVSLARNGAGLGAMWGRDTASRMLGEAGFQNVEIRQLDHDIMNDYYIVRKA